MNLSQIFEMATDRDVKAIREGKFDTSEFEEAKLQALVDKEEISIKNVESI